MEQLIHLFPGVADLFAQELSVICSRLGLILVGILLAGCGVKRIIEPQITIPMGVGMIAANAGLLLLGSPETALFGGALFPPSGTETAGLADAVRTNVPQSVPALIVCLIVLCIGAMSDLSFVFVHPWICMILALFGKLGVFVALVAGRSMGLSPGEAVSAALIGGADGPLIIFAAQGLAKDLLAPMAVIAYLYLGLIYIAYPRLIKAMIPAGHRGVDMDFEAPRVGKKTKLLAALVLCALLCLLLPAASPLVMSFFLGAAVKEAEIKPLQKLLESAIPYGATFLLGLIIGALCDANLFLNPKIAVVAALGFIALSVSGAAGILGGWLFYKLSHNEFNPVIGAAAVSHMPATAKIAQKTAMDENPYCIIMPIAMGTQICGVVTTIIATGVLMAALDWMP